MGERGTDILSEKSSRGRIVRLVGVLVSALLLSGCGKDDGLGRDPSEITPCTREYQNGPEAIVDSSNPLDNPESILAFVKKHKGDYRDTTHDASWRDLSADRPDGLGEIVCSVNNPDGTIKLVFLPEAVEAQADYEQRMDADARKQADDTARANTPARQLLDQVRQQTTTTAGSR